MLSIPAPFRTLLALSAVSAALLAPAFAAPNLVPHRAVYDIRLDQVRSSANLAGLTGLMAIELQGSACEGYTVNFRLVTQFSDSDGKTSTSDLRSSTFESGAGESFRFLTQNYVNRSLSEETNGIAQREDKARTEVALNKPQTKRFDLPPDVLFPTEHLKRVIEAAESGLRTLEAPVFDGSESGEKVYQTSAVIGGPIPPEKEPKEEAAKQPELRGLTRWPVTISYYEGAGKGGEQTPVYEVSFELYANGVSRDLLLDYGDFAIRGELSSFSVLPTAACP